MSTLKRVKISALGTYVPPRLLTNSDLAKMVDTNDEWIMSRVGIKERHMADKGVGTSDLAAEAAKVALAKRGISASELDAIIVATVTPDMMFPATACLVQHKIGAPNVWGFDLSAGCSQFVYALQVGAQFVSTGAHKKVMVIGADVMSSIIDYTDRATCVLFGDGAGAVILEPAEDDSVGLIDFMHEVDGSGGVSLYMPGGGSLNPPSHETVDKKMHYVHQDGQQVFKYAVRKMYEMATRIYEDGTPKTKHNTSNVQLDIDEAQGTARSTSYYCVTQATPELPLQVIVTGHYKDTFHRLDGVWWFDSRTMFVDQVGDVSHHLKF